MNDRNASHKAGGEEARDVGDDAASEADHDARPVRAVLKHLVRKRFHGTEALAGFPTGKEERDVAEVGKCLTMAVPDIFCGDDKDLARALRNVFGNAGEAASFDNCGIAGRRSFDGEDGHKSRCTMRVP